MSDDDFRDDFWLLSADNRIALRKNGSYLAINTNKKYMDPIYMDKTQTKHIVFIQ